MKELIMHREGLKLTAHLYGEEDRPLVILIHGFPDTPHSWDGVVPRLVSAGYQVLVPWLRGYTPDSARRHASYGILPAAHDIMAWMRYIQADSAHLVGHDWGAAITMALESLIPEYWKSISLLAVPPIPNRKQLLTSLQALPRQLKMSSYMLIMQSSWSEYLLSSHQADYVKRIWQRWSPTWQFSDSEFQPTRQAFSQPDVAWAASRYYRSLFSVHLRSNRIAGKHLLRPLQIPTLALAGRDDGCMNIRLHQRLSAQKGYPMPIKAVYLEGCGHFLQAEQPEVVVRELLAHFQTSQAAIAA